MSRCILHLGMPKTGSTSIQETLFFGLKDPRFCYFSAGEINGSRMLITLASNRMLPGNWAARETDPRFVAQKRADYASLLGSCARNAMRQGKHLILSGENGWYLTLEELANLKAILNGHGLEIEVIVYLRPWKGFLESRYQQVIKAEHTLPSTVWSPFVGPKGVSVLDYQAKVEQLDEVFGRAQVSVRKFDPHYFPDRCIVQDFGRCAGIDLSGTKVLRTNDSLSLKAIRLLAAYRAFPPRGAESRRPRSWSLFFLLSTLGRLSGEPLRFHSSLVSDILAPMKEQIPWLEDRMGKQFREDLERFDSGPCLRSMKELLCFDQESLQWLAERTGCKAPQDLSGEVTGRWVAEKMERLRFCLPSQRDVITGFSRFAKVHAIRLFSKR